MVLRSGLCPGAPPRTFTKKMKADNNSKGGMILGHSVLSAFRKGMQPPILESDDYQNCIIQLSLDLVEGTMGGGRVVKGEGKLGGGFTLKQSCLWLLIKKKNPT